MKKYSIILLIILSACSALRKADTAISANQNNSYVKLKKFNGDTLGYVQHNFIDNKKKYVGKDLNTLLKDVEIPIKSYVPGSSMVNVLISPNLTLQFYTYNQSNNRSYGPDKPVDIIIVWPVPLLKDSIDNLWSKTQGEWTKDARKYFRKQIIGNIVTTKWK